MQSHRPGKFQAAKVRWKPPFVLTPLLAVGLWEEATIVIAGLE